MISRPMRPGTLTLSEPARPASCLVKESFHLLEVGDQAQASFIQGYAVVCGYDLPRGAIEEPGTHMRLQLLDSRRYRGARQA